MTFEEIKATARRIDEGIAALEKKLENPSLIGYLDDDSQERAITILDMLMKDLDLIDEHVMKDAAELVEDIHEIKRDCEGIQEYIEGIEENIETMEEYGKPYGYVPPAHLIESDHSDSSDVMELSQNFRNSTRIEDESPGILDDSDSLMQSDANETRRQGRTLSAPTPPPEMNETFTTPYSKFKVHHLKLPDASDVKNLSYSKLPPAVASSSPKYSKPPVPRFNLDDTSSTVTDSALMVDNSSSCSQSFNSRNTTQSHFRPAPTTSLCETPPEPKLSSLSQRYLHKSAVKKRPLV